LEKKVQEADMLEREAAIDAKSDIRIRAPSGVIDSM
jgi:hypothetical protein